MKSDSRELILKRAAHTVHAAITAATTVPEIIDENFLRAVQILQRRKGKILITGVGKSGFIGMKMAATLVSLGHEAVFLNPLDALHGDSGIMRDGDVLVLFSFSGTSSELRKLVSHCSEYFKIKTILITGNSNAVLSKEVNQSIIFHIEKEGCPLNLAPMASTTTSLIIADAIASALTSPRTFNRSHFAQYHPAGSLGLSLKKVSEVMRSGPRLPMVAEDAVFEDALRMIARQKLVQIVGVVDKRGRLIGAFSDGDIRRKLLSYGDLRGKSIVSLMNSSPRSIRSENTLDEALELMHAHKINNLFVIDHKDRYIGFIHIHDIVK